MAQGAESDATAKAPFQRRHTKIPRAAWRFAHTYSGVRPLMPTSRMSGDAASRGHRHSSIGNHSLASGRVNEQIVDDPDIGKRRPRAPTSSLCVIRPEHGSRIDRPVVAPFLAA